MRFSCVLVGFVAALSPLCANAGPVYEGFQYRIGSSLSGQNGGTGWAGAWGGSGLAVDIASGLTFGALATSGGAASSEAPLTGTVAFYGRELTDVVGADNTTLYLSVLLRPDTGFGFYGGVNLGGVFIGKSGPVDLYSIEGPTNAINSSAVAPVAGTTVFLVLRAEFLPGNDRFSLYVNPTPGGPEPATPDALKTDFDLGTTNFVFLNNAGAWTTDEIRIGSTFASVTSTSAVPEPATWSLLAAAIPVLVLARRRRAGR